MWRLVRDMLVMGIEYLCYVPGSSSSGIVSSLSVSLSASLGSTSVMVASGKFLVSVVWGILIVVIWFGYGDWKEREETAID